jgi:hypothetical protein
MAAGPRREEGSRSAARRERETLHRSVAGWIVKPAASSFHKGAQIHGTDTVTEYTTATRSTAKHGGLLLIIIPLPISLIPTATAQHYSESAPEPLQPVNTTAALLSLLRSTPRRFTYSGRALTAY